MIDVTHRISAVARRVGTRTLAAGEARVITVARSFPDPVEEVWDACTTAERIQRWLMPVSGELRLGGRYQLEGNAGGVVERCDPPRSFDATWEYGGDVSWIELRLEPEGGPDNPGTRFTLEHIAHVDDARWTEFGPGAVGVGWDSALFGLALYLISGTSMDPAESAAWIASEEGKRFLSLSSERWCDASIAAGTDPAAARAAADRTTAAYTAPAPPAGEAQ
jgi:uncharacterized protein YndB with AHSA1/START domain